MKLITYTPDKEGAEIFYACGCCGTIYTSLTWRPPVANDPRAAAERCCCCQKCGEKKPGKDPNKRGASLRGLTWCPYSSRYLCPDCLEESQKAGRWERDRKRLESRLESVEQTIPMSDERAHYMILWDDDRFRTEEDLADYFLEMMHDNPEDIDQGPPYVFATRMTPIEINIDDAISDAIERAEVCDEYDWEFSNVEELKAFVDQWNSDNGIPAWYEDPKTLVDVSELWEECRREFEAQHPQRGVGR